MKGILTSIRRTPYQSLATFLVLFVTLFLSAVLLVAYAFSHSLLDYVETRPQVTAYFQTNMTEEEILKVKDQLVASGKTASVKYISKEEAYNIYKDINKTNPLLLEMVSSDILPPSLEVFAKKPIFLPEIAEFFKKQPGIDEVNFQKDIVDRLLNLTTILKQVGIVFFCFLIFMSVIVLTTNTLFKISLKKDEIELLRLLGATRFYIEKPFLLEGSFLGICASAVSFLIISGILLYFNPFLSSYLKGINELSFMIFSWKLNVWPLNEIFLGLVFLLVTLFGIVIAICSNLLAANKYLK